MTFWKLIYNGRKNIFAHFCSAAVLMIQVLENQMILKPVLSTGHHCGIKSKVWFPLLRHWWPSFITCNLWQLIQLVLVDDVISR